MNGAKAELWTIGHSNQECARLVELLRGLAGGGITAVADVRSVPYSQYTPQFNREVLEAVLGRHGIKYVFMGKELGARREERECYVAGPGGGKARYELVRKLPAFEQGLERLRKGVLKERIALMCSEKDPVTCHRMILICRALRGEMEIGHIVEEGGVGGVETQAAAEGRLLKLMGLPEGDLFHDRGELIERAYEMQGEAIAYVEPAGVENKAAT